jgi:hypothetical protein
MTRPTDAIVTGFVKSPLLLERSLAPLRRLKHEGIIRDIHYVTWDTPELDRWVEPVSSIHGVTLTRVPQPDAPGSGFWRGVVYQVANLKAGLKLLRDRDGLVLKWRPDFCARHSFIRDKIVNFDQLCTPPDNSCLGVAMPKRVFQAKLWIPWADCNAPFFFEDAAFLGQRRDVEKLVTPLVSADREILDDPFCGSYGHAVRYGQPFAAAYPLLAKYLRHYRYFPHEINARRHLLPHLLAEGFYWHLLIAHAWILHSHFHVDIGVHRDLSFYSNAVNREGDWSRYETLRVAPPYDGIAGWREGTEVGHALPSVSRVFGRLMDDAWQKAIFTTGVPDLAAGMLEPMLQNIAQCRDGRLNDLETTFYRDVEKFQAPYRQRQMAG